MRRISDVSCSLLVGAGLYELALAAYGQPSATAPRGMFLVIWGLAARLALGVIFRWLDGRRASLPRLRT